MVDPNSEGEKKMTVLLNKEVDRIELTLLMHLEDEGIMLTETAKDMIQQALLFAYKRGSESK